MKKETNRRRKYISVAAVVEHICISPNKQLEEEELVFLGKSTGLTWIQ